jgi:cell division protease FtsH
MERAEKILNDHINLLHKLAEELLEREILDADEIDKIIRGEELQPIKKDGSEETKEVPDHVKKLLEQRKLKEEPSSKDDSN